jgi:hypothetical protein
VKGDHNPVPHGPGAAALSSEARSVLLLRAPETHGPLWTAPLSSGAECKDMTTNCSSIVPASTVARAVAVQLCVCVGGWVGVCVWVGVWVCVCVRACVAGHAPVLLFAGFVRIGVSPACPCCWTGEWSPGAVCLSELGQTSIVNCSCICLTYS